MARLEIEVSEGVSRRLGAYCAAHKTTPSELFARLFGKYTKDFSLGDVPHQVTASTSADGNVYNNFRTSSFSVGDVLSNISILNGVRLMLPNGGSIQDWTRLLAAACVGFFIAVVWFATL